MSMLDHPKKKTKIWLAIADGLRDLKIEMSPQQVRWKMNALTKRYKECVDSNSKTGRGTVEFQWFDQLDEIFGDKNNAGTAYTVSSKLCFPTMTSKNKASNVAAINEQSEDREKEKKQLCKSHFKMKNEEHAVLEEICSLLDIAANKQTEDITSTMQLKTDKKLRVKRATHGTDSNIAKSKIELGKQWHQHLQDKIKREAIKEKQYDNMIRKKEEILQLKQKQIELKEKELQQKKTIASNKMKDKEKRHAEILSLEMEKCKLFRAFLKQDTGNTSPKYYSDLSN
ncbi:PREDICTED: pericentrin-like [Wasmannia auropunctata]|uniref:pericentrin-like n=1 Tax=Wasmannia auropunctata TaxID=64793 RepID=UPI0005F04581|nr:PREDICTED: pericentrin-like [Wasmannia auropunctata]